MLKILLKKQLMEVFRSYFYDAKKNKKRSKASVILMFGLFGLLMIGVLGGMFTYMSLTLCGGLTAAGVGWLYFAMMSGISILLGIFGSVFNTFASLYLAKDNDLLLSMPIPVKYIIVSRLLNVYILGTMYSAIVFLPALIVNWVIVGATAANIVCGILLLLIISLIVLILSCLLGWCVAKISLKMKHKSFVTVLLSLAFIAAYYYFYAKAGMMIQDLLLNAAVYGAKIKGAAYGIYLFGRIGEGDIPAALIGLALCLVILALTWMILRNTFLSIATASGKTEKKKYAGNTVRQRSLYRTLLAKEMRKFISSPTYMLNCGLGVILIPAAGIALLIKGSYVNSMLSEVFGSGGGYACILFCAALCMISGMNIMAAPSISLEGKSIWILQSLPVEPKAILRAKALLQALMSGIPMLFASVCVVLIIDDSVVVKLLLLVFVLVFVLFSALFDTFLGILTPNLLWTNEIMPIKQSGTVLIATFSSWGIAVAFAGLYFAFGYKIGLLLYLACWTLLFAVLAFLIFSWLDRKGADRFANL